MNKVYFNDDIECEAFFDTNLETHADNHDDSVVRAVAHCKRNGHIKKSDLEMTREIWNRDKQSLVKSLQYIESLEKALEAKSE